MSVDCQFDIDARLIESDGETVLRSFHDHDNGVHIQRPLGQPRFGPVRSRSTWRSAQGDVPYGIPRRDTGILPVNLLITGDTWPQVEARLEAIEADLWAENDYFIETELEGVIRRYITDVPSYDTADVSPADMRNCRLTLQMRFIVQPLPVTTIPV